MSFNVHENYPRKLHALSAAPKTSFSREKDHTITMRQTKIKVIPEIAELRDIRKSYTKCTDILNEFLLQNPPTIISNEFSAQFSDFKVNFETFLSNCSLYFKTAESTRRIGRFSPLLEFSTKMLRFWTNMVSIMNGFGKVQVLPHFARLKQDIALLNSNVQQISDSIVMKTYYKESVAAEAKVVKFNISQLNSAISKVLKHEPESGFTPRALSELKFRTGQLVKMINEKYIILLPSNVSSTPEIIRIRSLLQSAGGDLLALLDSSFNFRSLVSHCLNRMKRLDNEIRKILDEIGIKYTINIIPEGDDTPSEVEEEEPEAKPIERNLHTTEEMFNIEIPDAKIPVKTVKTTSKVRVLTARSALTPRRPLQPTVSDEKIAKFVQEMEETLGLVLDDSVSVEDKLDAIKEAVKVRLQKPATIEENNMNNTI